MNTPLSYSVTRWKDGGWQHIDDAVSPEEPVYVSWSGSSCRLWAWPDDLEPLAIGTSCSIAGHLGPEAGPFAVPHVRKRSRRIRPARHRRETRLCRGTQAHGEKRAR